jgi:hypothetical protein
MKTKTGIILLGQGEGIMKTKARIILLGLVIAIAFCYVTSVRAESNFAIGAGATADASLNFEIVIPPFVYFRVGNAGSINTINFSPTATDIATPGAHTAATGGDALGGAAVNVVLISNGGDVTITPTNLNGGLTSGGNTISYTQINTSDGGIIATPNLTNAGGTAEIITSGAFGITNLTDVWTYEYINPATPPAAGTYTDQVTYTASIP